MKFDWQAGYPSTRVPVFARNIVSTSHPLAAQAGLAMIQRGGNAVDAAIAAAAAMTIVEPCSNGLGSDAFAIVWHGGKLHGLNASGGAPQAWSPEYFRKKLGADADRPALRGWDSVTVPGAVAGWVALSERFGKLPFAERMTSESLMEMLTLAPVPPSLLVAGIPPALERAIMCLLEKKPESRFPSAESLAATLALAERTERPRV